MKRTDGWNRLEDKASGGLLH